MKNKLTMLLLASGLAIGATTVTQAAVTEIAATGVTLHEDDEIIEVTLSSPSDAALGAIPIHSYTIQDNDSPPSVAFGAESLNGAESLWLARNQLWLR